jgi:2'-5' RNA ligase
MQALAIICSLDITSDDRAWIEAIRGRHDPQHDRVEAHVTLVFPATGLSQDRVIRHLEEIASRSSTIAFRLNRAMAVRDSFAPRSHVFLLPRQGDPEIRRLHASLYGGELAPLRTDIPFHPHVTVAAFDNHSQAEDMSHAIGAIDIGGRLQSMALMSVEDGVIRREGVFPLLGSATANTQP